jgi:uncharacterized protein (TIGR00255 family)
MIKSMTGYGRSETIFNGKIIVVESKSVNHRFLEVFLRLPAPLFPLEMEYKRRIAEIIKRGRVEVVVKIDGEESRSRINLNLEVAREYYEALKCLKQEFHLESSDLLRILAGFRDIFTPPDESPLDADVLNVVEKTLLESIALLAKMRQDEGLALYEDMIGRLDNISEMMKKIRTRAPQVVSEYQKRLSERIRELTSGYSLDEARLAQEVAIMADRTDITEEVVRMQSHINQFGELLRKEGSEGKRIDFLLQEMNREINTIGSKVGDVEITRQVIEVKSELGKLREQAQNIE